MAIRKADLIKYKVQDSGDDPCTECTVTGNSPIVIAGKPYCLWCALRAACEFLGDRRMKDIMLRTGGRRDASPQKGRH